MHIISYNLFIINQLKQLLVSFSNEQYTASLIVLTNASVGQHIRHIIDFYLCIADAISNNAVLCYEKRRRMPDIEQQPDVALHWLQYIADMIHSIDVHTQLLIEFDHNNMNNEKIQLTTTLGRELVYCAEHAIHHFAIIKPAIQQHFSHIQLPADFGVAPSTIKYQQPLEG